MKEKYKLIIFDLDGTLIDSLPYHSIAFKDLLLEKGIRIDDGYLKKLIGMPTASILKQLKKRYKFKEDIDDLREERRFHYFKFLGNRNIVFSGITNVLKKLRLKYKIAIATGSSRIILTHSTDKDFQELFDFIITINDVKKGKPSSEQFILVSNKLHVKPKSCVVIGDSIYDAMASKSARMDFIGITTGCNTRKELLNYGAMKVINSLKQLEYGI